MKHIFTFFFLLVVLLAQAQTAAQKTSSSKWHYGPKLDLNLTHADGKGLQSGLTSGIQVGAFFQRVFSKKWSIQPEVLYRLSIVKKADDFMVYYNTNGRSTAREVMQLNTLTVPVLARYELSEKFSLLAGPQYAYLYNTDENLIRTNIDAFKKNQWSAVIGGQFNLGGFAASLRYVRSITDINAIDERYSWYLTHFQVGFAVRIK